MILRLHALLCSEGALPSGIWAPCAHRRRLSEVHRHPSQKFPLPQGSQSGLGRHELQSGRGGRGGLGGLQLGFGRGSHRGSRRTHTVRLPQSSTPRSTSAHSPGRQGFSINTLWHACTGGLGQPQRSGQNSGTLTHGSVSHAGFSDGNKGICP